MLEKDIEYLIAHYPEEFFPNENLKLISQQYVIAGRRIDLLFEDKHERRILVEIKSGVLTREDSGQITEYYGLLKGKSEGPIELILVANSIPYERRTFLENVGISCVELSETRLRQVAGKYSYHLSGEKPEPNPAIASPPGPRHNSKVVAWIFQGSPKTYDVYGSLANLNLKEVHWTVNQYKNEIKKDRIGLIWMAGKKAGIYAVTHLLSDPQMMEEFPEEKMFWVDPNKEESIRLRVLMSIRDKLHTQPILRTTLRSTKGLEELSILKYAEGTNFPVTASEWQILSGLIYGEHRLPDISKWAR